jgi:hypothetical protein
MRTVKYSDLVDWRANNVRLAKAYDPTGHFIKMRAKERAATLYTKVSSLSHFNTDELRRRAPEMKAMLEDICEHSLRIALLFRETKVEYKWMQLNLPSDLNDDNTEVLDNLHIELSDVRTPDDFKTVFGGVLKGNTSKARSGGEEPILLRKNEVILGPFKP